jgi:hypothetical protein
MRLSQHSLQRALYLADEVHFMIRGQFTNHGNATELSTSEIHGTLFRPWDLGRGLSSPIHFVAAMYRGVEIRCPPPHV